MIVDWFEKQGHSVWIVGGAIRNALLEIPIVEYDLATTMVPDKMKTYPDMIPTGEKFGTITFRSNGDFYEITTLRNGPGKTALAPPRQVAMSPVGTPCSVPKLAAACVLSRRAGPEAL